MSRLDELRHIAGSVGIATRHVAALGLPSDPAQAAEALAEEGRAAPFGLSPVQIVAQETATLILRLPAESGGVEWHCRLEDGGESAGKSEGAELHLPPGLPLGYHRLAITGVGETAEIGLVVAPDACHLSDALRPGARNWGLTAQLYGVRSARDWGIGDFSDLATLGREAGRLGTGAVGINPLHALFAAEPGLARLSLHRRDPGPRLCRGCCCAGAGAGRCGPCGARRGSGRLRRGRRAETPGARGALPALPRA